MSDTKTKYVLHLDDELGARRKFKKAFVKVRNQFKRWIARQYGLTGVSLELEQASTEDEFLGKLLEADRRVSEVGSHCVLFVLDHFLDAKRQSATAEDLRSKLERLFPAIPCVMLTKADSNETASSLPYLDKGLLQNPDELAANLVRVFDESWSAHFWDRLRSEGLGPDSWHTPGHNRGNAFKTSLLLSNFYDSYTAMVFRTDLSVSVSELGDLSEPLDPPNAAASMLNKAQTSSAKTFGADKTFYITNGTSTSNKAMLQALIRPGDTVLLDRNCHKSVHQAVVLSGAVPMYLSPAFNTRLGVWAPVDIETLERFIAAKMPDKMIRDGIRPPRVLVLTTCSYEGVLYPVRRIAEACERRGILLYSDEAWAPHMRFHPRYASDAEDGSIVRANAVDAGAHLVVHSSHKTLAALSQASMIHVTPAMRRAFQSSDSPWSWLRERFRDYNGFLHDLVESLRYWNSTSPSYPMLATLDLSSAQMRFEGLALLEERMKWVDEFRDRAERAAGPCIAGMDEIVGAGNERYAGYRHDPLKLVLGVRDPDTMQHALREHNICPEKSTSGCIQFLMTVGTTRQNIQQLAKVVEGIVRSKGKGTVLGCEPATAADFNREIAAGQIEVLPRAAAFGRSEMVPLEGCIGRIAAQMIVPYPPGIPVFLPGLRISVNAMQLVKNLVDGGRARDVHGLMIEAGNRCRVKVLDKQGEEQALEESGEKVRQIQAWARSLADG